MSTAAIVSRPRTLFSADGQSWSHDAGTGPVTRIVIGTPPRPGTKAQPVKLSAAVKRALAEHLPTVTHLHLWQVLGTDGMTGPYGTQLKTLDLRGCPDLTTLPRLPDTLETLVLEDMPGLHALPALPAGGFPALWDVSLARCPDMAEAAIHALLAAAPKLRQVDFSGCQKLKCLPQWPAGVVRVELNDCRALTALPGWPAGIRRAGLKDCAALTVVPAFPVPDRAQGRGIDFLDLRGTENLRELPENIESARSLFLFGAGVELPPTLFGENKEANVAKAVHAYLEEAGRGTVVDHEVKVILLGNGRCGKSSLVRRLVQDEFDPDERSTHGIRLRTLSLEFTPVDETAPATARLNLWDFAGQDLYHNTHRTFMQSKAVYLLCVTNHGDGSRPENDHRPDLEYEQGDDVRRKLRYWREQVEALGTAPGMDGPPPVLLVRMKADRDGEPGAPPPWPDLEAGEGLERFSVSAETGAGLPELREALSRAVAKVLGPRNRRSLGKRPMKVKEALRPLRDANEAAFLESERQRRRVPSPHPVMSREDFDKLVRSHCPGSDYDRDPGLLLEQFHLSGFLWSDPVNLPQTVILDQPWALEAVYTVMHRGRCHPRLRERGGRFRPADLAQWAWSPDDWNPAGYTPEEQELFLKFMESHRVVAKLFEPGERYDGQAVYVAPYYLPAWAQARQIVEPMEAAAGPPTARAHFASIYLGRDVAQSLLIGLVRQFSRAAEVWSWGAYFRAASLDAAATLHWRASNDLELYGGQISIEYRGAEARALHDYLVERLRALPAFPRDTEIEYLPVAATTPVPPAPVPPVPAKPPGVENQRGGGIEYASREEAIGIRVGISYAGSNPQGKTPAERNLGALPMALAKVLRERGQPVLEYSDAFREANLPRFTEDLVKQDYLVVFLSDKYFKSPYCMWELMLLYKEPPEAVFPPGRALFLALPGVPITGEAALMAFREEWLEHWEQWCGARKEEAANVAKGDHDKYNRALAGLKTAPWFEFASHATFREALLNAVFQNCFNQVINDPAAFDPGKPEFDKLAQQNADEIQKSLGDCRTIYRVAAREWQRTGTLSGAERKASRERAIRLYQRAYWLEHGAAPPGQKPPGPPQCQEADVQELLDELHKMSYSGSD